MPVAQDNSEHDTTRDHKLKALKLGGRVLFLFLFSGNLSWWLLSIDFMDDNIAL